MNEPPKTPPDRPITAEGRALSPDEADRETAEEIVSRCTRFEFDTLDWNRAVRAVLEGIRYGRRDPRQSPSIAPEGDPE